MFSFYVEKKTSSTSFTNVKGKEKQQTDNEMLGLI